MQTNESNEERRIACVATYPPRRCGIATFASDLCRAIERESRVGHRCQIIALDDRPGGYEYPPEVRFQVRQQQPTDYLLAADFANLRNSEVALIEHEYGIFGGEMGEYLLPLLRQLRMPVITTLHTVLPDPSVKMQQVTADLIDCSDRVVVMSHQAAALIAARYGTSEAKLRVIPHGIPDLAFVDPCFYKDRFGVQGRQVLLTFGLLSPGKGIEYAIRALPPLVQQHPELVYIVLGGTHPHIRERRGEEYRHQLQHLAADLHVQEHVLFHNRYVDLPELCEFLMASDIYLSTSLDPQQIASGTLAYAMGAGKPVVSTAFAYAREMLADGRGCLVPFRDSPALTREVGWGEQAWRCFDWFLGRNDLGTPLYNYATGGCRDGLQADGVNENEGAESTLAWLLSLRAIRALVHADTPSAKIAPVPVEG